MTGKQLLTKLTWLPILAVVLLMTILVWMYAIKVFLLEQDTGYAIAVDRLIAVIVLILWAWVMVMAIALGVIWSRKRKAR